MTVILSPAPVLGAKAPPSPFWALLPQAHPPWAALPGPAGHPWVLNRAAYSSETLSVPSWSIKAAKCLCSSLSAPSNITLGMAKRTLRDAVFRRRWSLAAFWELRNCPGDRHTKPSVPAKPKPGHFPPQGFNNPLRRNRTPHQGNHGLRPGHGDSFWAITCHSAMATFQIHPEKRGGRVQGQPGLLGVSRWHLRSPAANSSVLNRPVPAASSPSKTSSSSSVLHGKSSSCNF